MNNNQLLTSMFLLFSISSYSQTNGGDTLKKVEKSPLYITSGKKIFSGRSIKSIPKEAIKIATELLKIRTQCKKGNEACHLSCANGITMSQYLHTHLKGKMMMDLSGIEKRTLDYVSLCIKNTSALAPKPLLTFIEQMQTGEFTRRLNETLGDLRTTNIQVPKHMQTSKGEEFFDDYTIDTNIEHIEKSSNFQTKIKSSFEDVVTAFVTLENYCPVNDRGCIAQLMNGKHNLTWAKLNVLFSNVYPEEMKREAALTLLIREFGTMDYEGHPSVQSFSVYSQLKKQPEKYWPAALLTLEKFAQEIIALEPSKGSQTTNRLYCTQKNASNPFMGLEACEYLSAIYFGDFQMVAKYDLIFTESALLEYEVKVFAKDDFWAKLYQQQKANNQHNPKTGSLIQFILLNYMMEYNYIYSRCLKSDATIYTYSYEKVTEMKNRYGMTVNSWSSSRNESFKVNPNLVSVYESSPFRMNTQSVGFQNMLQSMRNKTPITNALEEKYGIKRLGSNEILKSLANVMKKNQCDSDVAKKLETRMIEYNDARKKYDPYISKFEYKATLGI